MFADWNVPIGPKVLDNTDIDRLAALHITPGGGRTQPYLFARKIADDIDLVRFRKAVLGE